MNSNGVDEQEPGSCQYVLDSTLVLPQAECDIQGQQALVTGAIVKPPHDEHQNVKQEPGSCQYDLDSILVLPQAECDTQGQQALVTGAIVKPPHDEHQNVKQEPGSCQYQDEAVPYSQECTEVNGIRVCFCLTLQRHVTVSINS